MIDIFISHSSADKDIAAALIALLRSAIPSINPVRVRCTSVPGYRLPGGADTDDQLRQDMVDARVFVGLITAESIKSTYVLFELGARWGAGRQLTPLMAAGMPPGALRAPLDRLNAHSCGVPDHLHQLVDEISSKLGLDRVSPAIYSSAVNDLVALSKAEGDKRAKATGDVRVYTSPYEVYTAIPNLIEDRNRNATAAKTLSIGILHGKTVPTLPGGRPELAKEGPWFAQFDKTILQCIESRGPGRWHVKEFKNITTPDRLTRTVERLEFVSEGYEVRAVCIPNLVPCLSPLIVGEEDVFLATMDTGSRRVGAALHLKSAAAVEFVKKYFSLLWDYEDALRLRTEEGTSTHSIDKLLALIQQRQS
jgi:hypothetical protein